MGKINVLKGFTIIFALFPLSEETCRIEVEKVDCKQKNTTNLFYTCHSDSSEKDCLCVFENPLRSDSGWYKMCKTKSDLKLGKKIIRRRRQVPFIDKCGPIQAPKPGKVFCSLSFREIRCTGKCDFGYRFGDLVQEHLTHCYYREGIWIPRRNFPPCEPTKLCTVSKKNLIASHWQCKHSRSETVCDISCKPPGTPVVEAGFQTYFCGIDGLWSPPLPQCVQGSSLCPHPGDIPFATSFPSDTEFKVGDSVSYACDPGYVILGRAKIICQSNGKWIPEIPKCVRVTKSRIPNSAIKMCVVSKNLMASHWHCNHTRMETVCDISCKPPGTPVAVAGYQRHFCGINGIWFPPLPPCVQGSSLCVHPGDISFGTSFPSDVEFKFGDSISYECDPGYVILGSVKIVCQSNGKWTQEKPKCVRIINDSIPDSNTCDHPGDISFGSSFPYSKEYKIGDSITYECDTGYVISGSAKIICQNNGKWIPEKPACVHLERASSLSSSLCSHPGNIPFGTSFPSDTEFETGDSVSYECDTGYAISGNTKIVCQSNGKWGHEKPKCFRLEKTVIDQCPKPNAPQNSVMYVTVPDQSALRTFFNSNKPLLQRLYLTMITNDTEGHDLPDSEGIFMVGTRVQYKCKSRFYKLYGSEYQTCETSHTWSGYQPSCVPECGKSDSPKTPYIVNGDTTRIGEWPWMVGIALKNSKNLQLICGGTLISESFVVTAAHCVTKMNSNKAIDARNIVVFCGKYYRNFTQDDDEYIQRKQVKQIIIQEEYDFIRYDADIALLRLEDPVELTTRVQPICLPTEFTTRENLRDGKKGMVIGWGLTENGTYSDALKEAVLPVVSHDKCEEAYREGLRTVTITKNMFCAGHESGVFDTCSGDSGGPYMFSVGPPNDNHWYLEGLVSWGSKSGCAKAQRYSGFTKVGMFVSWINMYI